MNCLIYKIQNLENGKVYIGSTKRGSIRLNEHKKHLFRGRHKNKHLQYSFDKYGFDNFDFSVIEYVDSTDFLIIREQYWIDYYKSTGLYNVREIADRNLGIKHSKETRNILKDISNKYFEINGHKSIYDFWIDKYGTEIADDKMIEYKVKKSLGVIGDKNPMYGKSGINSPNLKKISQFEKNGEFVREWDGIILAGNELSIYPQNISECCLGKRKSAGGYIWKFSTMGDYCI